MTCAIVCGLRRNVPLALETKLNWAAELQKGGRLPWTAPSKEKVAPAAMSGLLPL
jgi:hypothetical protein